MKEDRYAIPIAEQRVQEYIERSRFVTTVAPADTEAAAQSFIQQIREEFPDATHHCWAYVVGSPGSTARIGMSDDGEPHGTAGRPMLQVLLHSGLGDVVAVVTRDYGGVKLGKGGLGRAYSGGVRLALESILVGERIARRPLDLEFGYAALDAVRRLLSETQSTTDREIFEENVRLSVAVPLAEWARFHARFQDVTQGLGRVQEGAAPASGEPP
jgi:uncharacterized YigZ family protein